MNSNASDNLPSMGSSPLKGTALAIAGFLLAAIPVASMAQQFDGFDYSVNGNNISITGYYGPGGVATIPTNIDGLVVTEIGANAFRNATNLTGIVMPATIVFIGSGAFELCSSLTSAPLPASVTSIGGDAFAECGLTNVTIPPGVTYLAEDIFTGCQQLTNVTFPSTLTNIGPAAFAVCSLASITIPPSVNTIGSYAFEYNGLTNVVIPDTVTSLGGSVFFGCARLANFTIGSGITSLGADLFGRTALTNVTISSNITSIGEGAFDNCFLLTNVTVAASVTNIAEYAFAGSDALKSLYFLGAAPEVNMTTFDTGKGAIAYYLPATTGWEPLLGTIPTEPWLPQIATGVGVGLQNNQFGFNINWADGQTFVVEVCTDLANPVWQLLQTNTMAGGSFYFSDPSWTNYPTRYYRITTP